MTYQDPIALPTATDAASLLVQANTQWQIGDWHSLAKLQRESLQHHPDRAHLALLAAAGRLQMGKDAEAKPFIRLAQEWSASKQHIGQMLIAGVHRSLGRAAELGNQKQRVQRHFESAKAVMGQPISNVTTALKATEGVHQPSAAPAPIKPPQKFSSDADIDDFIEDIAPFFLNRSIVYVDVGAYIGEVFTKLLASKKIKIREAHLIEPNPESYRKLQDAAKASKMQSCNTYHMGISNHPGTAKFKAAQSMTKRVRADVSSEKSSNIFETECRKLDDIAELFTDKHVHLMKLDVEGEELDVLKSAEQLLKEQRIDVLYVEAGFNRKGTQQTYFGDLDALLQSYSYSVFKIYEQKNEWIQDSPLLRRCNFAYMSKQFAAGNPYKYSLEIMRLKSQIDKSSE